MKVFVTGATGNIGSAVVAELLAHDHTVLGLARSDASAAQLAGVGADAVRGGLGDLDVIRAAAADADGVIHLAFSNDFSSPDALAAGVSEETAAITAIGEALIGSGKPFVVCSGTPWVPGRTSTESDPLPTEGPVGGRAVTVNRTLALSERGVRTSAVRLPRTVHQNGNGGFAGLLTQIARDSGVSGYPGDGSQRWPAVHSADAAALFRLALENAPAGTSWHAVADEGDQVKAIAEVIGRRLDLAVKPVPVEDYGPLGQIFALDQPSSSAHTREALGWTPTHPTLLEDLEHIEH
ncbi:Nucleoside-diphosphate-sugar epimerase [Nocardioides terrae]|uniref:Nucleoside-diphosphate-sugar epimerase n=1 Tax=Nocardioides terrae TaxID=574651 RepID=A0A1I1KXY1_9ACTN|nr:SDR family oxidoreductase [Nocardioides terrae]SFC65505.1 Nucleoside-diphosphate-sugar epimerase [Nocardioides terrae]